MSGELDLGKLLNGLKAKLQDGVYVFATLPSDQVPASINPRMQFQEDEGTTLILSKSEADTYNIPYEFPSRMITLDVHSSLDAVGFMAVIATKLAKAGMGVNPVAGFYHDHLFVPVGRENDALMVLSKLADCHN